MSQKASGTKLAQQSEIRAHQSRQELFKAILSEDIDWKPFPAFPPSVRLAVVVGQPSESGPYTIRVKVPHGEKLMPHKHPEDRVYTVVSGIFHIGLVDEFDASKLEAYPPGAVVVLPGNTAHFHWAKSSEYVTQVTAMGPLGLEYLARKTIRETATRKTSLLKMNDHQKNAQYSRVRDGMRLLTATFNQYFAADRCSRPRDSSSRFWTPYL
jgi:quercetin dioxygenase-like cupin family protein